MSITGSTENISADRKAMGKFEFDDYARSRIGSSENIEVKAGYLPDSLDEIRGRDFDLICLFDVLEHIEDDGASLDIINNYLH